MQFFHKSIVKRIGVYIILIPDVFQEIDYLLFDNRMMVPFLEIQVTYCLCKVDRCVFKRCYLRDNSLFSFCIKEDKNDQR